MTPVSIPFSCAITVQTLIAEHPIVVPLLERFGISTTERTERDLRDAARKARVASATLCEVLAATIAAGRIAG